jgi:XTP/dITP diphosphohydrolase
MPRIVVLATRNPGKIRELTRLLEGAPVELRSLRDYADMPEPEETGETFADNAIIKAVAVSVGTGEWALADDSGLEVDALDGRPGVYSARFPHEGVTDEERNRALLELLADVPDDRRAARFRCVAALADGDRVLGTWEGVCEGTILREPRGDHGFGFDPVFYVPEFGCAMAELPTEVKNRISHRAQAFRAVEWSV